MNGSRWYHRRIWLLGLGVAVAWVAALSFEARKPLLAQPSNSTGTISGTVKADRGDVRALRIRASDAAHGIAYVVFTTKGRYRLFNLPPGSYELTVSEPSFKSSAQTVSVRAGATETVNIALTATGVDEVYREYGTGGSGYIEANSSPANAAAEPAKELVDYDVLYPPGPARTVLEKTCFACHGVNFFHGRKATETTWRQGINRMFRIGMMRPEILPDAQREEIIKYLAANFGPDSKPRDLKKDRLVRDEAALADAVYIEYELPPTADSPPFADGSRPRRGTHSVYVSEKTRGVIWASDQFGNAILRLDTRDSDPKRRFKEYRIENAQNINTHPHGIVEQAGRVYWVERLGDHVGELNPDTGEIRRYPIPTKGGHAHTIRADAQGNLWYSFWAATSKVGKFDIMTKTFTEFESDKHFNGYGLTTDQQGRVWAVGMSTPANDVPRVHMYNPENLRWSSFETSGSTRRVAVDSKGKVWVCQYFGNAISLIEMTDRINGKVTNYPMPLKYGNPYEIWPDAEDNLWMSVSAYGSLVKFDQRTKTFTYFPYSRPGSHTPKMEVDPSGTLWFALNNSQPIVAFKPRGNVSQPAPQSAR